MKVTTYLSAVDGYHVETVHTGLTEMLSGLGGIDRFVRPGQSVLIKPNIIAKRFESQTHPVVSVELAKLVREVGGKVFIADSPAWGSLIGNARKSGLLQLARENGISLFELRNGRRYNHLRFSSQALDADVIINVPKLKTHQMLKLSAGIKNMFGCVPGKLKAWWHFKAGRSDDDRFARMLVETYRLLSPALTIIDAIDAMEGRGPISGTLRHLGVLIGSPDGFAAETVACELVGCDPETIPV